MRPRSSSAGKQLSLTFVPPRGAKTAAPGPAGPPRKKTRPPSAAKTATPPPAHPPEILRPAPTPARAKAPAPRATAESMARLQRDISISEFFAKNRHLLGFDNKRKALLMSVKEAVDNSLDACEEAGHLPDIDVTVHQVAEERFRIIVRDNGPGIVMHQVPNVFGRLLYGSKFHRLKMSRGQQGIGISAAGMYGLLTTGKSIKVTSRTSPKKQAYYCEIQIDTRKNAPVIVRDHPVEVDWPCGTQVEIELVGSYNKGRQSVDEYVEQTAIANPHARFAYTPPVGERIVFDRGTDVMPAQTIEIKPHPYGVELGTLIKMLHETKSHWLCGFLQGEFCRVGPKVAAEICRNARLNPRAHPKRIARQEAEKLYEAIRKTRLTAPPTNCLAPIGAEQILTGLLKGIKAEFFAAATRPPAVYRGNPFQIEVGIAYGGELGPDPRDDNGGDTPENEAKISRGRIVNGDNRPAPQCRVIRFANRVPLLYQQSACCMFKSVLDLDWRRYALSQSTGALPQAPLAVLVHMASVWVPFTSESKEAIADYDEIRQEIRLALQDCGRKLSAFLNRRRRQKYEGERRGVFERYIPEVVEACATIKRVNRQALTDHLKAVARNVTRRADEQLDEHGKARKPAGTASEFGPNTVVVDRAALTPGELFSKTA